MRWLTLASLSLCACVAWQPAPSAPSGAPGHIGDAAFLAGVWVATRGEARAEEYWTPSAAGQMLGAGRELRGGKLAFFEHLRIEERGATLVYVALPFGKDATDFTLAARSEHELVFENPAHDFPKRIIYRLEGQETLLARVEGEGGHAEEWRYVRAP